MPTEREYAGYADFKYFSNCDYFFNHCKLINSRTSAFLRHSSSLGVLLTLGF